MQTQIFENTKYKKYKNTKSKKIWTKKYKVKNKQKWTNVMLILTNNNQLAK